MAKLLGRLGWRGQCSCCSTATCKKTLRVREARDWRAEAAAGLAPEPAADLVAPVGVTP